MAGDRILTREEMGGRAEGVCTRVGTDFPSADLLSHAFICRFRPLSDRATPGARRFGLHRSREEIRRAPGYLRIRERDGFQIRRG